MYVYPVSGSSLDGYDSDEDSECSAERKKKSPDGSVRCTTCGKTDDKNAAREDRVSIKHYGNSTYACTCSPLKRWTERTPEQIAKYLETNKDATEVEARNVRFVIPRGPYLGKLNRKPVKESSPRLKKLDKVRVSQVNDSFVRFIELQIQIMGMMKKS